MNMKGLHRLSIAAVLALGMHAGAQTPPDVRPNHWALPAVREALANGVLSLEEDHNFHGDARVTHAQAVIALAKLARALETDAWRKSPGSPITSKVVPVLRQGDWQQQPVTRFTCASILARFGDYIANGLPRPAPGATDLAKSTVLGPKAHVTVPKTDPAYASLVYLAERHMIWPGSRLLTPDDKPIRGVEFSIALHQMVTGLTDQLTSMGHDETGATPDKSFHAKPK